MARYSDWNYPAPRRRQVSRVSIGVALGVLLPIPLYKEFYHTALALADRGPRTLTLMDPVLLPRLWWFNVSTAIVTGLDFLRVQLGSTLFNPSQFVIFWVFIIVLGALLLRRK